jgi:hypothetical protein
VTQGNSEFESHQSHHFSPAHATIRYMKYNKSLKKRIHQFVIEYLKSHPCVDCSESCVLVLEFDHLQDKKFGISTAIHNGYSLKDIKDEIAKCEVRCSNCHLKKTHRLANSYKWKAWIED